MKKRLLSLLLAAVLLLALLPAASAEAALTTEQEVLDFFALQKKDRAEEFSFTCSKALFQQLMADNAARLSALEIMGGIGEARVRYSEQTCLIRLSGVKYTDEPWAECATEEDARLAMRELLTGGAESFYLLCPPALAKSLAKSANLRTYAALAGFCGISPTYYASGVIRIAEPEAFSEPWAAAEDAAQFNAAVDSFALQEQDSFYIAFPPALYERLADEEQRAILHAGSMMDRYTCSAASVPGVLHYTRVSYTEQPCLICRSEEDVVSAIARMGELGIPDFRLYLASDELRTELLDTPLAYVHKMEARGGLRWGDLAHSDNMIHYIGAHIEPQAQAPAPSLGTLEEVRAVMEEQAAAEAPQITLFLSPELYEALLGEPGVLPIPREGMEPLYELVARTGIRDYELFANRRTGTVVILVRAYASEGTPTRAPGAAVAADSGLRHYVLNTNTMRFHYPDCPSAADISERNRMECDSTREALLEAGYSPCGRCHP